jgi:hypothetical protein
MKLERDPPASTVLTRLPFVLKLQLSRREKSEFTCHGSDSICARF